MADNTQTPVTQLPRRKNGATPSASAPVTAPVMPTTTLAASEEAVEEAVQAAEAPPEEDRTYLAPAVMQTEEVPASEAKRQAVLSENTDEPEDVADAEATAAEAVKAQAFKDRMAKARAARGQKAAAKAPKAKAAAVTPKTPKRGKKGRKGGPTPALDASGIKELAALAKGGKSLKQAAKALKIAVLTASRYAKQNGITFIDGRKLRWAKGRKAAVAAAPAKPGKRKYTRRAKTSSKSELAYVKRSSADVKALAKAIARELGKALRSI